MTANDATTLLEPYANTRVIELKVAKDKFCGFEDRGKAQLFEKLAPTLVPYNRHFCYEDGGYDAGKVVPFYSPCCSGRPGKFFPCKHLVPPPQFYAHAAEPPPFCSGRERGKISSGRARYALNDWQRLADAINNRKAVPHLRRNRKRLVLPGR